MASNNIPYIGAPGSIVSILEKIKSAAVPDIFSADFLATKLGFKGGNKRMFISWAKKTGMLHGDGSPTQLYKEFRNPDTSKYSLSTALRNGYKELYDRNEYCHDLDKGKFKELVMQATGESHDSKVVELIVSTFFNAKMLAAFERSTLGVEVTDTTTATATKQVDLSNEAKIKKSLGISYTINLVLPKTDDPAVFNAIFKSLSDNLLKE